MRKTALLALVLAGCAKPAATPAPASPAAPGQVQGTEPADEIKPVYGGHPTPDPLASRLCELFASYPLQRQATCCGTSQATASFSQECARIVTVALAAKHLLLDQDKVATCEKAYKAQLEDCDRVMSTVSPPPEACQELFAGTLAAGAPCRSALECQAGLTCVGLGPTTAGRCAPPAPPGAPCHPIVDPLAVFTKQSIDEGHPECSSYCDRNRCADFLALGAACVFDTQCGPKNRCSAKRCVAGRPALGGKCSGLGDCPLDATCSGGSCRPRGKTGSVCGSDDECLGECDKGATSAQCGPKCPHAFVPIFSRPGPTKK